MPSPQNSESERLGPSPQSISLPVDVWLVDPDGRIEGPPTDATLAGAIAALAREAVTTGATRSEEFQAALGANARTLRLEARPGTRGDVIVVGLGLDRVREIERDVSRYDLVLRATRSAIWEWNVVTRQAWWNPRQYEMFGYDSTTTTPSYEAWLSAVHPDDRERVSAQLMEVLKGSALTWEDEFRFFRSDGSVGLSLDIGYIERDESGQPLRMIGVMSDITEQRAAVLALKESEERFRQLATAIHEVFWLTNAEGSVIYYVSPAYESIWGRSCQSVYDNPKSFLDAIHEDDRELVLAHLTPRRAYDLVYRITRPSGAIAWIRDRAFLIYDDLGNIVRVAGVAADITAQRSLEEQLLQSQKLESIGRLAGGVAHDFNNLLTIILSGVDFAMRDLPVQSTLRADLIQVKDSAERAAKLTSQLLTFARRQVVAPQLLDLNDLAQRLNNLLCRVIGEHVELRTVFATDLHLVLADPGQIEQVLLNLVVNARDAMPDGGRLTIETQNLTIDEAFGSTHVHVPAGEYVMLAVSDTGMGIEPDALAHIFEPFFTTKPPGRGTGLGLATCYGTIRQAGGQILVYSEPGRGATFKVLLPRASEGAQPTLREPEPPRARPGTETILVVEDDEVLRGVAVRILREHGYEVLAAGSGPHALDLAKSHPRVVDLVLTDVVMPRMGGVELARRLVELCPEIRVLYASGYTENWMLHNGVLDPEVAFLPKPYVAATLLGAVRSVLDGS